MAIEQTEISIALRSLDDTARLGALLPTLMARFARPLLLLQGDLGAGKTTLTRMLVRSLPGGLQAEVSSPSFTVCNSYATTPPVLHFDLYRLDDNADDENLTEALEALEEHPERFFLLVEWPERLPKLQSEGISIHCILRQGGERRTATLRFAGSEAHQASRMALSLADQAGLERQESTRVSTSGTPGTFG